MSKAPETSDPPGQTMVLCTLARAEVGMAASEVAHVVGVEPQAVSSALETLQQHDVVIEAEGRWRFTVELMRRWVARNAADSARD